MNNKIILTTALKGGVGKSCLCANFATFFVEQGQPVMVLDADIQQSISRHRKRDLASHPSALIPWQVLFYSGPGTPDHLRGCRRCHYSL